MRRLSFTAFLMLVFTSLGRLPAEDAQPVREWLDNTGTYAVRAQLLPEKSNGQQVTLMLENGRQVTLPLRRLSREDREFIASNLVAPAEAEARPALVRGIQWQDDLDTAARVAAGGPSVGDDKPILCFRALGEFSGFM